MTLKKTLAVTAITALSLCAVTGSASAALAPLPPNDVVNTFPVPGDLKINKLGTDAVGSDTYANRNREFLDVKNTGVAAVNITNYRSEDAWAYGDNSFSQCNTFKVKITNVDPSMVSGGVVNLDAGHTLRIYTGAGTPAVLGTTHFVYIDSPTTCGASGQYITNAADDLYFRDGTPAHNVVAHVRFNRLGGYEVDFS